MKIWPLTISNSVRLYPGYQKNLLMLSIPNKLSMKSELNFEFRLPSDAIFRN